MIGVQEVRERGRGIFEKIMANHFPDLKDYKSAYPRCSAKKISVMKKKKPGMFIIKLLKASDKEKISKAARENMLHRGDQR